MLMARKPKEVMLGNIDRREVGYYSTPSFVARFLTEEMLALNPNGRTVLDPAVGKEELLKDFYAAGKMIDSFDIVDYGKHEYSTFRKQDFIEYYSDLQLNSLFASVSTTKYDYIIANPPYNCHEVSYIQQNKKKLKSLFPVGVYNMYSMFLSAIIDVAKDGCLIGVVISDSFLTATYHAALRKKIFETCAIHELILCPTDLFWSQHADVRTCLLILQKGKQYQSKVMVSDRPANVHSFCDILSGRLFQEKGIDEIQLKAAGNQIVVDVDNAIVDLFHRERPIGTKYRCVTCISTGNDAKYLRKEKSDGYTVPFYKNPASRKFKCPPDAFLIDTFMDNSVTDKNFMVRNRELLDQEGIVCSSMGLPFSAAYLPHKGVTGVNASIYPPHEDIFWLLSYLNSSLVTYLIRGVLIRSNMVTSGYVSTLPLPEFDNGERTKLEDISHRVIDGELPIDSALAQINAIIYTHYAFSKELTQKIDMFSKNISVSV